MRVATGRDQLQQMTAEQRSADEASAAETLQHYATQVCARTRARIGVFSTAACQPARVRERASLSVTTAS
jgi:hypothetical protein